MAAITGVDRFPKAKLLAFGVSLSNSGSAQELVVFLMFLKGQYGSSEVRF